MNLRASEGEYCTRCRWLIDTSKLVKISGQLICVPCWRIQIYAKLKYNISWIQASYKNNVDRGK